MSTSVLQQNLEALVNYKVVDKWGKKLGKVKCTWPEALPKDSFAFIGVKIGLFGKIHVVPVKDMKIDTSKFTVRLGFPREKILQSPIAKATDTITAEWGEKIYIFYSIIIVPKDEVQTPFTLEPGETLNNAKKKLSLPIRPKVEKPVHTEPEAPVIQERIATSH